jgi:hypothetical protein
MRESETSDLRMSGWPHIGISDIRDVHFATARDARRQCR